MMQKYENQLIIVYNSLIFVHLAQYPFPLNFQKKYTFATDF
jgi:hypothetical protein